MEGRIALEDDMAFEFGGLAGEGFFGLLENLSDRGYCVLVELLHVEPGWLLIRSFSDIICIYI